MNQMGEGVKKLRGHVVEGTLRDSFALEWRYYKSEVEKEECWSRVWV